MKTLALVACSLFPITALAGTLTVIGHGDDVRLSITSMNFDIGDKASMEKTASFKRGMAVFKNVPSANLLFLGTVETKNESVANISRVIFEENGKVQSFGSSGSHAEMEIWQPAPISKEVQGNLDFISLLFNPSSPSPDLLYVGEGPSDERGSAHPAVTFNINGKVYTDRLIKSEDSMHTAALEPCEVFEFANSLKCHGRTRKDINRFWFNADKEANFRGVALRAEKSDQAAYRFFFRYGNVNFQPEPTQIPRFGPGGQKWEYRQNFAE